MLQKKPQKKSNLAYERCDTGHPLIMVSSDDSSMTLAPVVERLAVVLSLPVLQLKPVSAGIKPVIWDLGNFEIFTRMKGGLKSDSNLSTKINQTLKRCKVRTATNRLLVYH